MIFDEAQRAWDAARSQAAKHTTAGGMGAPNPSISSSLRNGFQAGASSSVLSDLKQEIHEGEEAGVGQWARAIEKSAQPSLWTIHADPLTADELNTDARVERVDDLRLTIEVRYHLASRIHEFVGGLLRDDGSAGLSQIASDLSQKGYFLRITRHLETAKEYLRERFRGSDRSLWDGRLVKEDKDLVRFGVLNDFQSTKRVKNGLMVCRWRRGPIWSVVSDPAGMCHRVRRAGTRTRCGPARLGHRFHPAESSVVERLREWIPPRVEGS